MNGPPEQPRFRAMEIGPGGFPADRVRVIGAEGQPEPPPVASPRPVKVAQDQPEFEGLLPSVTPEMGAQPAAVLGSFDGDRSKPSRRAVVGWLVIAVVVAVVAGASLWSNFTPALTESTDLVTGDCLLSAGDSVIDVGCSSADAEYRIAAQFKNSTNSEKCSAVSSDLVLVTRDDTVLCLDYLAKVGDCLYAGAATQAGKAPCRTPGSTTTPPGLFRVIGVLRSTTDPGNCPKGTIETLVHTTTREVLCLGLP
jgi:hypothetical protein